MATSNSNTETKTRQQMDKLSDTAHSAVDRLNEQGEALLAMKDDYVEQAREYVKENPIMAIGIALAAGYLFGKITSWR